MRRPHTQGEEGDPIIHRTRTERERGRELLDLRFSENMARGPLACHLWICVCILLVVHSNCFYLPGVAPQDFQKGDPLKVKVDKLSSTKTQLPYSYYTLAYCRPDSIIDSAENLGEVLRGDRIENSPYVFKMREPQMCNVVCRLTLNASTAKEFKEKIDDEYRVNMILDNLPLVVPLRRPDQESSIVYLHGFLVGLKGQYAGKKDEKYFINNHLTFVVKYHPDPVTELSRIVGFEVKPFRLYHDFFLSEGY